MIETLIKQYRESLRQTRKIKNSLEQKLKPYKEVYQDKTRPKLERFEAKEASSEIRHDLSIVSSWESNLLYSLEWMSTAKCPGSKRGIERRAAYEREKPFDPIIMQRFFRSEENVYGWDKDKKENSIGRGDKERINHALSTLTEREKEAYLMAKGNGYSQYSIAIRMNVTRDTVKTMLKRAEKKIAKTIITLNQEGDSDGICSANSR